MFTDVKTQPTEAQVEGYAEPSMVPIQRSREAAQRLWAEIGRLLAGNPFAPAAALTPGDRGQRRNRTMRMSPALLAALSLACALPQGAGEPLSVPVSVRSHNRSSVDVYLLCGNRDAEWLGVVHGKHGQLFEIPASRTWCIHGLNFFLVHRGLNRGYWVGPVRLRTGSTVHLTIEKYAGLSAAQVSDGLR